jgi:hypothetical protein
MPTHLENTKARDDECMAAYLDMLPALAWRVDIVRNDITFLNAHTIPSLGEQAKSVLQNPGLARQMIFKEDRERFFHCFDQIRNRQPSACTFRMRSSNGTTGWFKIMAMPDPAFPTCAVGLLMDIGSHVNTILSIEGRPGLSDKIDLLDDPVLLIRFSDRKVFMANQAAQRMLHYPAKDIPTLDFDRILQKNSGAKLFQIYEGLIFSDCWNGELSMTDSMGRHHQCMARIQAIARDEENLLWVTLTHMNSCLACKGIPVRGNESVPSLEIIEAMRTCTTIKELLKTMLNALPPNSPTDAIMLSRIFIAENKVLVTGAGGPFETIPENHTHPYEGSIAENIVRFNLPHHVVMETSKSIKPIDWALFIPRGIHSYYAQPFFDNDVLTNVLIFCSSLPGNYDPDAPAPLHELYPEFLNGLKRCLNAAG